MKRSYRKKNIKFWTMKRINRYSLRLWKTIVSLMTVFVIYSILVNTVRHSGPLVSPLVIGPMPVYASEKVTVSCEKDPKSYLECQVYQGKITWGDHKKLFRIVNECENKSWNPNATNVNTHKDGSTSIDRGIFMINDRYHKKLTNEKAYDFKSNIDYAISLYKRSGTQPWVCAKILNIK